MANIVHLIHLRRPRHTIIGEVLSKDKDYVYIDVDHIKDKEIQGWRIPTNIFQPHSNIQKIERIDNGKR